MSDEAFTMPALSADANAAFANLSGEAHSQALAILQRSSFDTSELPGPHRPDAVALARTAKFEADTAASFHEGAIKAGISKEAIDRALDRSGDAYRHASLGAMPSLSIGEVQAIEHGLRSAFATVELNANLAQSMMSNYAEAADTTNYRI